MSERKIILALLALRAHRHAGERAGALGRLREPRAGAPGRQQLEARLRQRLWSITKNRVGFTDEQMTKLAQTSRGFDARRRQLAVDERQQRQLLRREILAGLRRRPVAGRDGARSGVADPARAHRPADRGAARLRRVHDPRAAGAVRRAAGAAAPPSREAARATRGCGLDARRGRPALTFALDARVGSRRANAVCALRVFRSSAAQHRLLE